MIYCTVLFVVERIESAVKSLREEFGEQHVVLNVMLEKHRM